MKFLCVLCALCGLALPAHALDREAFTFTRYQLEARIEPEQQRLAVRGKIILRNDSTTAQKNLVLQISSTLSWISIQADGKAVEYSRHEYVSAIDHTGALSEAVVTLPQAVLPGRTIQLEVGYEGVVPLDTTRLTAIGVPEDKAKHSDWDQISRSFSAVRGIGYVAWYPVASEAASLSNANSVAEAVGRWRHREIDGEMLVDFCSSVEQTQVALAQVSENIGGEFGEEGMPGNPWICATHRFVGLSVIVPLFVSAKYQVMENSYVTVAYRPDHRSGAENYALAAELAAPLVTEWFGTPRRKGEVTDLAEPDASAFESGTVLLDPLTSSDTRSYQLAAVHQLTHAALFSSQPWIYEGAAHFAQALEQEQLSNRQAALDFMGSHRAAIVDGEKAARTRPDREVAEALTKTSTEEFYRSKAMYVLWMLRDMVGDAALKRALASYQLSQDRDPSYVQHSIETQSKRDLQWFFDDWVYHDRGLADFRIDSVASRSADGASVLTVSVENLGDAGAEVPIVVKMARGETTSKLEVRARSKATVRITVADSPLSVTVNDGSVPESDLSNNTYKIQSQDTAR